MARAVPFSILAFAAVLLSVITVHYSEKYMMPIAEYVRLKIDGEQIYSTALTGCQALEPNEAWVHPTTLALTVYGDVQRILATKFGPRNHEVLPNYAGVYLGEAELICAAEYFLSHSQVGLVQGRSVRAIRFDIPYEKYGLSRGWVSGLTQGLVGQVFIAAHIVSADSRYLDAAREVGNLLAVPIENGGVLVELEDSQYWYEEYAQPGVSPPLVLNGHLLAMDFLHWMTRIDDAAFWSLLYENGSRATVAIVNQFLGLGWSYYDSQGTLASQKYHLFHIRQLNRYEDIDTSGKLADARRVMQRQLIIPVGVFQRLFMQPTRLLLFLIGLCFVMYFCVFSLSYMIFRRSRA